MTSDPSNKSNSIQSKSNLDGENNPKAFSLGKKPTPDSVKSN